MSAGKMSMFMCELFTFSKFKPNMKKTCTNSYEHESEPNEMDQNKNNENTHTHKLGQIEWNEIIRRTVVRFNI